MTGLGMVSVRDTAREMTAMVIVSHVDPRKWCQRRVPVWHQFQLALYPTASVLRLYVELLDDPEAPFCMETFFNVGDPNQLRDLQALAQQSVVDVHSMTQNTSTSSPNDCTMVSCSGRSWSS